jgi:hypothetical protein
MRSLRHPGRRGAAALAVLAAALVLSLVLIARPTDSSFTPTVRADPVADLLGWLPATDDSRRAYAAWTVQSGAPLDLTDSIDRLTLSPTPLALGRSAEWQRTTGISASQVSGWASAPGEGVTVLAGDLDATDIGARLAQAGYEKHAYQSVPVWVSAEPLTRSRLIEGDDLRAMNAIAVVDGHVVIGWSEEAVHRALEAAAGVRASLATEPVAASINVTTDLSGLIVLDQRDFAIDCGVGRGWLKSDFAEPSGRVIAILYHLDGSGAPVTSVWAEFADDIAAEGILPTIADDWQTGFANQIGLGGRVSDIATVQSVRRIDAYVVADLAAGRENGWVRSGIRYLVALCEQSSLLIPRESPQRATPVASPSPMEAP